MNENSEQKNIDNKNKNTNFEKSWKNRRKIALQKIAKKSSDKIDENFRENLDENFRVEIDEESRRNRRQIA